MAAVSFVGLAALIAFVPVPFVSWSPGGTVDTLGEYQNKPVITLQGIKSYPTTGRLDLTTVSVTRPDSELTLPQALIAYWLPNRDALPRGAVYPPEKTPEQVETEESARMQAAQHHAAIAALREAGEPVQEVPAVLSVSVGGPADKTLRPGDLIMAVDEVTTPDADAVARQIQTYRVDQPVTFTIWREGKKRLVQVTTGESPKDADQPFVGITLGTGYRYDPTISIELGHDIGGPSAGLVFALAIYDKITDGTLVDGRHVAGTGGITPTGVVTGIGGIQEKIAAAEAEGATVFLVPAPNCQDLAGVQTSLTLVKVETLAGGIAALGELGTSDGVAATPRCHS